MDVLRITTNDYELTVRADGVDTSFRRAALRNTSIENSTIYTFTGGHVNRFELAINSNNDLGNQLTDAAFELASHPVFFENKDYYFDIVFRNPTDAEPVIYSSLAEVKKSFISRKVNDKYFLTGAINYRNDIGKSDFIIRYNREDISVSQKLSFEVFPVKLDYKSDYKSIIADINKEFSSLVFDVLKKTYTGFKEGGKINNDIIWWGVFGQLYKEIISYAKLILNKPHNRLVRDNYFSKADRIRNLNFELEEQIAEHRENSQKYYRVERKTLTTNTFENQFFKYSVLYLLRKFISIKNKLLNIAGLRMSDEFKAELEQVEKEFSFITHHPFFKQISEFRGMKQESLVLQKATGYSSLFRSWIILKRGIDFLDGVNKIELKNIADLYQIWCFIEMKNMIQDILKKNPEEVNLAEILVEGFSIQLRSGRSSKVSFKKDNGDLIELFHELKYTGTILDNTLSHTVNQEPDIVLRITKNDLQENLQLTYLFDAKYRLVSDDTENGKDYPPDDAINQMHRYRDAIFYQDNQESRYPKKEVIGAYVLFPGADDAAEVENLYFQKSINKVNIGAYPLIPGAKKNYNSSLLKEFLKKTLEVKESLSILNEDILPYKAMKYEDPDAFVLAGFLSSNHQKKYFASGNAKVYHIPVYRSNGSIRTIRNLNKLKYFCPIINGVTEYYEIIDIKVIPRRDIFERIEVGMFRDDDASYFVFSLRNKKFLPNRIETAAGGNRVFRYAKFSELQISKSINEFNKTAQEIGDE
ncbi:MAG: DUF2357 domain-containing protein [Chitinophagaceae bacterium]|nr:DUF2357 domain-containing protein [Chitinophagaceae bacterium]